jgi:N-acetylmuramoyl-L-alanine amidase
VNWKGVCIHHSLTADGPLRNWEAIRRYHVETNKFAEIGYHFGVENVDGRVRLRIGRPHSQAGAHAKGLNTTHLGLCIVGNFDVTVPLDEHLDVAALAVADMARFHKFPVNEQTIRYHNEVHPKSCPGKLFPSKAAFLERVRRFL